MPTLAGRAGWREEVRTGLGGRNVLQSARGRNGVGGHGWAGCCLENPKPAITEACGKTSV
jgi:hypothetical protein